MKVLTIKQPWATLIALGYKKYEFRSWKTNYRGPLLIHAGKSVSKSDIKRFAHLNLEYPTSKIVASVTLEDCILVDDKFNTTLMNKNELVYGMNDKTCYYAWKLSNVKKIDNDIMINGKLGLWNIDNQ